MSTADKSIYKVFKTILVTCPMPAALWTRGLIIEVHEPYL